MKVLTLLGLMNLAAVALQLFLINYAAEAAHHELLPYNPVADPRAVIVSGNARFTVLTPHMIRIEYSKSGKFEDRATVAVLNRKLDVPSFTNSTAGGILTISTQYLKLQYQVGQTFNSNSLKITSLDSNSKFSSWYYGQANPGNLLGTIKSLDELGVITLNCTQNANVKVHDESLHCEWGLISRDGWTVVDDQQNWALNNNDWWAGMNTDDVDIYFFGHGHNYKQALADYVAIGGKIAMVPRYTTGIWWSVWMNLDNFDVMQIVYNYVSRSIPLDVYILDMDWHTKEGWGGYTFDNRLFPYPANTLGWLHHMGLHTGANLHDDDGVRPNEKMFTKMALSLGLNPQTCGTIKFAVVNSSYMYALEDIVLQDSIDMGMDFWWIDWQQGGTQGGAAGGKQNPTIWLNHVRSTDHIRNNDVTRGLVLARWGGLGNHRYQVGFSGDVADLTWQNLAFQPYFSMTATNVGYGFWSHDIVGPSDDHELHTRWIQWGAFSGIFRTHDRGMSAGGCADDNPPTCGIVEIWNVPDQYFLANRDALTARERLIPYIYTASRQAFDTGLSLLRPMYYDFPEMDQAYAADQSGKFPQYMFGDDLLVSPIVTPGAKNTSMATQSIWIPPGKWIETNTGTIYVGSSSGKTILTKSFDLSEIPIFARGGSIIPTIPVVPGDTVGLAQRQYTTLEFNIFPGEESGTTSVYEDDGKTTRYLQHEYAWTKASYTRNQANVKVTITTTGSYAELPATRVYRVILVNHLPATEVMINGVSASYSRFGGPNTWHYNGRELSLVVESAPLPTSKPVNINIDSNSVDDHFMSGLKGAIGHSILAKQNLDQSRVTPGANSVNGGYLSDTASAGEELSYLAGVDLVAFSKVLQGLPDLFNKAVAEIQALKPLAQNALVQLWDQERGDNCLCGTTDCIDTNPQYTTVRVEGYQPDKNTPGVIPLNDFWDPDITDNYATTQSSTPAGYQPAVFANGYVFAKQQANTVPLQLFYNGHDMLTVASDEGIAYAHQNHYKQLNASLGYVYSKAPMTAVNYDRWAHSITLLDNARN